jgi:hypothetical protein
MTTKLAALLLLATPFIAGCSDEHDDGHSHGELPLECEEIRVACHEVDVGDPGEVNDCHQLAHDGHRDDCVAQQDTCIAICEAAAGDGGMHDGG